ncbi:MAG TPA: phosphoglycolate phosphatase [Paenalcaligenes hominis]|uniref:Phosphoglycolate phosphatase n=1 Tax=Paenalcaligenes hominis TaxID=643674 RepID=A0A9D2VFD9_9BURK|nr:phosphoglycolate phosphatase [Paenalcaligenes hominis]NJB65093.1 phosphoglycolate phosphatase [Paenalcaligenes hominis]GGE56709.1 phosphoglycolate phosphatase, bacterial [Paenalcaligenes hominis]HJH23611.1 phosphoglycolate phosphatase [Paenalcaligenes hominis]
MRYKAVLFDLDGTLVDSIPDIAQGANLMLHDLGFAALSVEQISTFVGKGTHHLIDLCLKEVTQQASIDPTLQQQARRLFAHHYDHQTKHSISKVFPGVTEGLDRFQQAGCRLAVVTNKPMQFVPDLLRLMHLDHYFDLLVGGDTCAEKKPHPMPFLYACEKLGVSPADALVIGDSGNDSIAARQAGIDVLLVPYGYNEGKDVQDLDCDGIVFSIVEAAQWAAQPNTTH